MLSCPLVFPLHGPQNPISERFLGQVNLWQRGSHACHLGEAWCCAAVSTHTHTRSHGHRQAHCLDTRCTTEPQGPFLDLSLQHTAHAICPPPPVARPGPHLPAPLSPSLHREAARLPGESLEGRRGRVCRGQEELQRGDNGGQAGGDACTDEEETAGEGMKEKPGERARGKRHKVQVTTHPGQKGFSMLRLQTAREDSESSSQQAGWRPLCCPMASGRL